MSAADLNVLMTPGVRMGCDLVEPSEIEESLRVFGVRFTDRVFTERELRACTGSDAIARLAARFAAKEAVAKLFADPDLAIPPTEIEVVGSGGAPALELHGSLADRARRDGWRDLRVSLSHTRCHAMAVACVSCPGTVFPGSGARPAQ